MSKMIEPTKDKLRSQLDVVIAANSRMADVLRALGSPRRLWVMFGAGAAFGASVAALVLR